MKQGKDGFGVMADFFGKRMFSSMENESWCVCWGLKMIWKEAALLVDDCPKGVFWVSWCSERITLLEQP